MFGNSHIAVCVGITKHVWKEHTCLDITKHVWEMSTYICVWIFPHMFGNLLMYVLVIIIVCYSLLNADKSTHNVAAAIIVTAILYVALAIQTVCCCFKVFSSSI